MREIEVKAHTTGIELAYELATEAHCPGVRLDLRWVVHEIQETSREFSDAASPAAACEPAGNGSEWIPHAGHSRITL